MGATVSRLEIEKLGGLQYKRALVARRLTLGINPLDQKLALCIHGDAETGIPAYHDAYFPFTQLWTITSQRTVILQFSTRTLRLYKADNGDVLVEVFSTDSAGPHVLFKAVSEYLPFQLSSTKEFDTICGLWV
jgi:hypothetical protein